MRLSQLLAPDLLAMLGRLHDIYHATLTESGVPQRQAASALLVTLGDQNGDAFARHVRYTGLSLPTRQLEQVLADAKELATAVITGQNPGDPDFRHGRHVRWLADIYADSDCDLRLANAGSGPGRTGTASAPGDISPGTDGSDRANSLILVVIFFAALSAGAGLFWLRSSFALRRLRAERQPRLPTAFRLTASFTPPDGDTQREDVESIDVSIAGMKLAWTQPPDVGTDVLLDLPIGARGGQIAWCNNLYAGIVFDKELTEAELESLVKKTRRP